MSVSEILLAIPVFLMPATSMRIGGELTVSDWMLAMIFGYFSILLVLTRPQLRVPPQLVIGVGLVALGGVISSAASDLPWPSLLALAKFIAVMLGCFVVLPTLIRNPPAVRFLCYALLIGVALDGISAIYELYFGTIVELPKSDIAVDFFGRMRGLSEHPNELGTVCAATFPFALATVLGPQRLLMRAIGLLLATALIFGVVLAASMQGVFSLVVFLIIYLIVERDSRVGLIAVGASSLFVAALVAGLHASFATDVDNSVTERISSLFTSSDALRDSTLGSRIEVYKIALGSIASNPLVGEGFGKTVDTAGEALEVHNVLLKFWFEGGVLAFAGILMILTSIIRHSVSLLKQASHRKSEAGVFNRAVAYSAIISIFNMMCGPVMYQRLAWIFASLAVALSISSHLRRYLANEQSTPIDSAYSVGLV